MTSRPAAYTHTATLYRAYRDVPVRKDGRFWVSKYQVRMALWHEPGDASDITEVWRE